MSCELSEFDSYFDGNGLSNLFASAFCFILWVYYIPLFVCFDDVWLSSNQTFNLVVYIPFRKAGRQKHKWLTWHLRWKVWLFILGARGKLLYASYLDIHVGLHGHWSCSSAYKSAGLELTKLNEICVSWSNSCFDFVWWSPHDLHGSWINFTYWRPCL